MISADPADRLALQLRMKKLFTEGFTVVDIAEPLLSFDADSEATEVASALAQSRDPVGGVRRDGRIVEYVRANDLTRGTCAEHAREIDPDQVVPHSAPIPQVVERLEDTEYCFVSVVGQIDAFVIRGHFEKPPVRMWLFGMITIVETFLTETIAALYPDDAWIGLVSTGRMRKTRELHAERRRREQPASLIDCLQLGDKAQILLQDPEWREDFEVTSRRDGDRAIKEFSSLRNNLAHAQPIVPDNWEMIVTASSRLDRIVSRIGQGPVPRTP